MGENIGAAARAMKNFGLSDLRLVKPEDGWPNPAADATSSHAIDVIRSARLYDSVTDAVADLDRVYAATARTR
jgi:tRNA/rRNA methyltransferase